MTWRDFQYLHKCKFKLKGHIMGLWLHICNVICLHVATLNNSIFLLGEASLDISSSFGDPFLLCSSVIHIAVKEVRNWPRRRRWWLIIPHVYFNRPFCAYSSWVYMSKNTRNFWIHSYWPEMTFLNAGLCNFAIKLEPMRFLKLSMSNLLNVWSTFIILKASLLYVQDLFLH